jgi:hypothetical protein
MKNMFVYTQSHRNGTSCPNGADFFHAFVPDATDKAFAI